MRCPPSPAHAPLQSWCPSVILVMTLTCLTSVASASATSTDSPDPQYQGGYGLDIKYSHKERLTDAQRILREAPLIDGHNDLPWNIRKFEHNRLKRPNSQDVNLDDIRNNTGPWKKSPWSQTDLKRLKQGLVGGLFWVAYVPCEAQYRNAVHLTLEQIDLIQRMIQKYPKVLQAAYTADDIIKAHRTERIASLIGVEGGHSIGGSLGVLRALYALGVRYLTLTHTCDTPWSETASSIPDHGNRTKGLTAFGKAVVREMNRLGMMVDLSHTSVATMRAALSESRAPVIFSHSSAHGLCNSSRNVPDDVLNLLKKNGGIVMVNFYNYFITCGDQASITDVARHINYIRNLIGSQNIGIGGDFDGVNKTPRGLEDVSKYPDLFAELLRPGNNWTSKELQDLAGQNLLRVMRQVEKVRTEMAAEGVLPAEDKGPPRTQTHRCRFDYEAYNDEQRARET